MQPGSSDPRVERLYRSDRYWAYVAVLVLWITIVFVFWQVASSAVSSTVAAALAAGAGLVLLFNSASILALLRHYKEDKEHIYKLDLHYLDEMKKNRRRGV